MTIAEDLIDLAHADPKGVLARGREYLSELDDAAAAERSMTLRAMSLGSRMVDLGESIEQARQAARIAEENHLDELRSMALLTLSGSLAIAGRMDAALETIDEGLAVAGDEHTRARFVFQRGAVLGNLGRQREAIRAMKSVDGFFRDHGDKQSLVLVLNRIGLMSISLGELEEAEANLLEAQDLASEIDDRSSLPGIKHNLGLLAAYRGDVPTSLERLQASDDMYMEMSGSAAPQHVARCEVLIGVGRFEEAADLAAQIAESNRRSGDAEHEANALLVAAQATLLLGDTERATELADAATRLLGGDEAAPRAIEAHRVALEARFITEGASTGLLAESAVLAEVLTKEGNLVAAAQANLLAGRMSLDLGKSDRAADFLEPVARISSGPVELRLQARLAGALLHLSEGDRRGASSAARSGLRLLDVYQQALGATDLRMGLERQGRELGDIGLDLAIGSRRPRRVLTWMELTRARALRHRPVVPGEDEETVRLLADLRRVEAELRGETGPADAALLRRRRRLQEQITRRDRETRGVIERRARFTIDAMIPELGDRTLLEIAEHDGALLAVLVRQGRAHLVELSDYESAVSELRLVRFGMRRAARLGRAIDRASLDRFGALVMGPIDVGGEVVVVPPPALMAAPWTALPGLAGCTVTVSPSAETWWRARQRAKSGGPVVVAGGPDLANVEQELSAVGALYEKARMLGAEAEVESVRSGLSGASIAHIVCHADFRADNPMFSSLRLGDGDLNVYDVERLDRAPDLVVLSACDSGYSETRPGEELAGLTSALLTMGTRSVVASVGLVPDSAATSRLMVDFHRGLIDGLEPSAALARAQGVAFEDAERFVAAASFICVGV